MANEITVGGSLRLNRSADPKFSSSMKFSGVRLDQSGSDYMSGTQLITNGASEATLKKGNITDVGWFIIRNLNTNAAHILGVGASTGQRPIKVPGGFSVGPIYFGATITQVYVIVDSGSTNINIEYLIVEN